MSQVQAPSDPSAAVDERGGVITRPLLLTLVGLGLVVVAALAWGLFGRAPETVSGFGYVMPEGGYAEAGTTAQGQVASILVDPGERVTAGQALVIVRADGGVEEPVESPVDGTVISIVALPGRPTTGGDPLVYIQPSSAPLVVKGFIPATEAEVLEVGMTAEVSPADAPRRAQYGVMLGTVSSISPAPVTAERISFVVGGNTSLVDYFLSAGPVIEATVTLTADPTTPSGYAWSVGKGPDVEITAGTLSEVSVVIRETSVIEWFPQ